MINILVLSWSIWKGLAMDARLFVQLEVTEKNCDEILQALYAQRKSLGFQLISVLLRERVTRSQHRNKRLFLLLVMGELPTVLDLYHQCYFALEWRTAMDGAEPYETSFVANASGRVAGTIEATWWLPALGNDSKLLLLEVD